MWKYSKNTLREQLLRNEIDTNYDFRKKVYI